MNCKKQLKILADKILWHIMIVCLSEAFKFAKAKSSIHACLSNLVQLTKFYCQTSIKSIKYSASNLTYNLWTASFLSPLHQQKTLGTVIMETKAPVNWYVSSDANVWFAHVWMFQDEGVIEVAEQQQQQSCDELKIPSAANSRLASQRRKTKSWPDLVNQEMRMIRDWFVNAIWRLQICILKA